jgi:sulfatase maturation enzyme AslB (radical SAM superfamily)
MRAYERSGEFLVVLPELPQWFIVDGIGKEVADAILQKKSIRETCLILNGKAKQADIKATYRDLKMLLANRDNGNDRRISSPLTSKATVAMISLTRRCNLRCPHCYVDAQGMRGKELTVSEHRAIADNLHKRLATNPLLEYKVNLTGGEPFCHPMIMDIISAYKDAGFEVTMSTNSLLIKKRDMAKLADLGVALSVSLDGATEGSHDFIRGKGAFKKLSGRLCP